MDFLLEQGTLSGFYISQAVKDLSQPLEKFLWRAGIDDYVIKVAQTNFPQ